MSLVTDVKIQNFKNISLAEFKTGKFNQIVGKNSQGKSAVNQAIEFAHQGSMDVNLIKVGEEKAFVELKFDDGAVLSRWLKRREGLKPTTAVKYERDGMTPSKVQAHLNKMIGIGTFDPRQLLNPKTRNQSIMEMIDIKITEKEMKAALKGIDVTIPKMAYDKNALEVIEFAEQHFFAIRTERNRETKAAKVRSDDAKAAIPKSSEELKSELKMPDQIMENLCVRKLDLGEEFTTLKQKVTDWEENEESLEKQDRAIKGMHDARVDMETCIVEAQTKLTEINKEIKEFIAETNKSRNELGKKPDIIAETERITNEGTAFAEEMERHTIIESVEHQEAAAKSLEEAYLATAKKSSELDRAINLMRGHFKQEVMASAELPIKGLEYSDGQFTLAGRSLDHLSQSESVIIGLQLTRKKNPNTNVICIDGGECLDDETYANLQKAVADDGFNYFLTKVGGSFASETDTVIEMKKGEAIQ